jgi:low temperature requirement protein LtrA
LRAGREEDDPGRARTARRYAFGITVCEVLWLSLLVAPREVWTWSWVVMLPMELGVPVWAEKTAATTWHPHHIMERYSLMTLIVIGESVLAATLGVQVAIDAGSMSWELGSVIAGAVTVLFSAWWLYFAEPPHYISHTNRWTFFWGYGHYLVFSSLAAVGAGLASATDIVVGGARPLWVASAAVAIPIAVFLAAQWLITIWPNKRGAWIGSAYGAAIVLVLASIALPVPALPVGIILVVLTIVTRGHAASTPHEGE